ncbi:MAG: sulfatase-like hydrolase/transferase [Planctomycetota bacterium]|nr:sulfatase-like hydrolase/transferase [Planctomycetota bacterium]
MLSLLAALPLATSPAPAPATPQQPGYRGNVCVIVMDDVGPGLLGCYDDWFASVGRPTMQPAATPFIDGVLAAQGLSFTRAWACPTCTPGRAAMLTGRLPQHSGIGDAIQRREDRPNPALEPGTELLPGLLRLAPTPYTSAALGKWHLASKEELEASPLHPLGTPAGTWFDRFAGTFYNLTPQPGVPWWQTGYYLWEKTYVTRIDSSVSPCQFGEPPCTLELDVTLDSSLYPTTDTISDAITLVNELPEPWFLWLSTHSAHVPTHPLPNSFPVVPCTGATGPDSSCVYPGISNSASQVRCMVQALDHQLGRLLCELDFGDTTVILVSDNGISKQGVIAPYSTNKVKGTVYQGGLEVPLIVRSPLLRPGLAGRRSHALVSVTDVFETVRQIAQAPAAVHAEDSRSLVPILRGQAASVRPTMYSEYFFPNFTPDPASGLPPAGYQCVRHDQALRDLRFKLIRNWKRGPAGSGPVLVERFFDLLEGGPPDTGTSPPTPTPDWLESHDLLAPGQVLSPAAATALAALRAELDQNFLVLVQ